MKRNREMKINELRIGNWYRSVKFGVPVRCDLSDLYNLCAMGYGAIDDPPISEMFEPIPLTEEWLLKMGFTTYDNHDYFIDISRVSDFHSYFSLFKADNFYYIGEFDARITAVHHLQNLYFSLTNEELTIKPKI